MNPSPYHRLVALLVLSGAVATLCAAGEQPVKRARPPKFDSRQAAEVFFEDLFQVLSIPPPTSGATGLRAESKATDEKAELAAAAAGQDWSALISAATLEDEVKRIKLSVDKNVGTPADFAARGHRLVRRDFTLAALLFGVIAEYPGTVRWQADARTAHARFAAAASLVQAGGQPAAYQEARQRKADLQDLVGGGTLADTGDVPEATWVALDRAPLMQRLETGSQVTSARLATQSALAAGRDELLHEGALTAAIGRALTGKTMDDGEDPEYAAFAQEMQRAALTLVQAVREDDFTQARQASGRLSKVCTDCHAAYR